MDEYPRGTGEVWLIGSGPSAQGVNPPENAHTACVNGSKVLLGPRHPDYYLVGERPAAREYAWQIKDLLDAGKTTVYLRPHARTEVIDLIGHRYYSQTIPVHNTLGKPGLLDLHSDRHVPHKHTAPGPRPRATWITSGVLMLWVLLEWHDFDRVVITGIDGYPTAPDELIPKEKEFRPVHDWQQGDVVVPGEYAPDVRPMASRPLRMHKWAEQQNEHVREAVGRLSRAYTDTELVFPNKPLVWHEDWNVKLGL